MQVEILGGNKMESKKKKIGIIIGIIIIIIAILGGVFAYLYFATDILKTPQQLFYQYLMKNEEVLEGFDYTNNAASVQDMLKDKQYTTNGTLTLGYKENSGTEQETTILTVEGKTDKLEEQAYSKISLLNPSNNSEELFNVEYLRTNNLYALTSNQVVNLYLAVQNNDLKSLARKLGIEDVSQIPDKIETVNAEEISKEQLDGIANKYGNLIIEQIPQENYTKQKNVSMIINEQNYTNLDIYTLTLNEVELANVTKVLLQNLKEDDETINVFISLYKTDKTIDDLNEVKNQIQTMIDEINNMELTEETALKMNVYAQDDTLVQTQVQLGNGTEEGITIDMIPSITEQEIEILFNVTDIQEENNFTVKLTANNTDGIKIEFSMDEVIINLTYSEQIKDENTITKIINVSYAENENQVQISYNEEKVITQDLKIDKLDSNTNCVILNNYSQEELQIIMAQVGERLEEIFTGIDQEVTGGMIVTNIANYEQSLIEEQQEEVVEDEKEEFNSQFTSLDVQNISSANLENFLKTIITKNNSNENNRKVGVSYNGLENKVTEEEINEIIAEIENTDSYYNVAFQYSEDGYINLITITQN